MTLELYLMQDSIIECSMKEEASLNGVVQGRWCRHKIKDKSCIV